MRYSVAFIVAVPTAQKAAWLRDNAKLWIERNGGTVSNWNASRVDPQWRVWGWSDTAGAAFKGTAVAETAIQAGSIVIGTATGMHVVHTETI